MIFYIGFILSVLGMISVVYRTFASRNILSPQIFVFAGILIYLYIPALANEFPYIHDNGYNTALLCGTIGCWVASFKFRYNIMDDVKPVCGEPKENIFKTLSYIYVCFLLFEIAEKIIVAGSITAVFLSNRLDTYLGADLTSNSSPIRSFMFEGLKIVFFFYVDMLYSRGYKKKAIVLFMVPMMHLAFTAVTRFDFLAMSASFFVYVLNKRMYIKHSTIRIKKKLSFVKVSIFSFIGVYIALLFMRYANLLRHGLTNTVFDMSYSSLLLSTFANDSNYYEFFYDLYKKFTTGQVLFEQGMAWFIAPFINFIPRAIWSAKPYTSFSVRGTEYVYWDYTSGNPVCTFTIFGEGFGQFGYIGCFLAPIIFLAARYTTFNLAKKIKYNQLYILIVMFSLFTFMRAEAPIFHALLDGFWLIFIRKKLISKQ